MARYRTVFLVEADHDPKVRVRIYDPPPKILSEDRLKSRAALAKITKTLVESLQWMDNDERRVATNVLTDVRLLYHQLKV